MSNKKIWLNMDKTKIELFWNDVKLKGNFMSNIHDGSLSIYESNPILNIVFSPTGKNRLYIKLFKKGDKQNPILDKKILINKEDLYEIYNQEHKTLYTFCTEKGNFVLSLDVMELYNFKFLRSFHVTYINKNKNRSKSKNKKE